jgi:hypothetical protein
MILALAFPVLMLATAGASAPAPAPAQFVSFNYAITFASPKTASYCPLPADWVGSDHGTILFLEPPEACGNAGYASSGRSFTPDAPRIEVYYGYAFPPEDGDPPKPCARHGTSRLFGADRPLCGLQTRGMSVFWVSATYEGNTKEAAFTLVTTQARLPGDLARFRALTASARGCTASYVPLDEGGKPLGPAEQNGCGPPCPPGSFF